MADLQKCLGTTIRRLRREQGLTLKELADRAAVSEVYLGEVERGQKYPSARVVEQLADSLEVTPAELLEQVAHDMRTVDTVALFSPFTPEVEPTRTPQMISGVYDLTIGVKNTGAYCQMLGGALTRAA